MSAALAIASLSPELLEQVFREQPASVRAEIVWRTGALRSDLRRLSSEPLDDATIDMVTGDFAVWMWQIVKLFRAHLGSLDLSASRGEMEARLKSICDALGDPAAAEAFKWSWHWLQGLHDAAVPLLESNEVVAGIESVSDDDLRKSAAAEARDFFRGETLLFACLEAKENGAPSSVMRELAWRAFEHICAAKEAAAADGLIVSEPLDSNRVEHTLRAIDLVRESLTTSDVAQLGDARVTNLR